MQQFIGWILVHQDKTPNKIFNSEKKKVKEKKTPVRNFFCDYIKNVSKIINFILYEDPITNVRILRKRSIKDFKTLLNNWSYTSISE